MTDKPVICRARGSWLCYSEYFEGKGKSVREAYMAWLVARKGYRRN